MRVGEYLHFTHRHLEGVRGEEQSHDHYEGQNQASQLQWLLINSQIPTFYLQFSPEKSTCKFFCQENLFLGIKVWCLSLLSKFSFYACEVSKKIQFPGQIQALQLLSWVQAWGVECDCICLPPWGRRGTAVGGLWYGGSTVLYYKRYPRKTPNKTKVLQSHAVMYQAIIY